MNVIRIIGDCGHPWYVVPDELSADLKAMPVKCPFCDCAGASIESLLTEMKKDRMKERKAEFRKKRSKRR